MNRNMKPYVLKGDQIASGAIDFSYLLDAPAGKHGFLQTVDGHFQFEDGTPVRFFGVNLVFGAAMPAKKRAHLIADRLQHSGINMVRLHHVDSYQTGDNTNTIIDYRNGNSQSLHPENMDRFDYLISLLKERGIYIHIDLFTLRRYLPEGDELDYEDSLETALKHVNYYNRRLIDLHKKYAMQYLTHRNPYTGLRYVDDPAVAVVQLLNENGIFWENGEVPIPSYKKELDARWNEWLVREYGSRERLREAWTKGDGTENLRGDEDPAKGTVRRPAVGVWGERSVDYRMDYTNIAGPARFADHVRFLTEIEMDYIHEMKPYLRELGVKCPIDVSNLPSGAAEMRCVAEGDLTENNCYWNHPMGGFRVPVYFHEKEMVSSDPRDIDQRAFALNMATKLSMGRVAGKPFMVTEWNVCYPTRFRSDVILMLTSYAALQDWDGLLLFAYAESGGEELVTRERMSGFFNSYADPAIWGLAGVASAIFQGRLILTGKNLVEIGYTELDTQNTSPFGLMPFGTVPFISRVANRFLANGVYDGHADVVLSSGFTSTGDYSHAKRSIVYARSPYVDRYQKVEGKDAFLASHRPTHGVQDLTDPRGNRVGEVGDTQAIITDEQRLDQDLHLFAPVFHEAMKRFGLLDSDAGFQEDELTFRSDTKELTFAFGQGRFTVEASHVLAFAGSPRSRETVHNVVLELQNEKAAITLLPRDASPIASSKHLLIAAIGESVNEGMVFDGPILREEGSGPTLIDPIRGTVFFPSTESHCRAYILDERGQRMGEATVNRGEGGFTVHLGDGDCAMYYEVLFS